MRTVGVDLAAGPEKTALAAIEWSGGGALLQRLRLGVGDDLIVDAVTGSEKLGIDCPLGWPLPFVQFIASHRDGHVVVPQDVAGRDWRRKLAFRTTDEVTRQTTGLIPLSVAADRIGHRAMRCAGLLARLAADGCVVDRRGQGIVVEVYPSASLKRWGLPHRGYKRASNAASLNALVDELITAAPWLVLGEHETLCRQSDDALDAVIAALTARAARLGLVTTPSTADNDIAAIEGWIACRRPHCQRSPPDRRTWRRFRRARPAPQRAEEGVEDRRVVTGMFAHRRLRGRAAGGIRPIVVGRIVKKQRA